MLDAKANRLFYDQLLKPPSGYQFDHAVTTTYSLDLEAILLVPIALFFSQDFDFSPENPRDDLIEALTKASEHISIFCQRGKIKVPYPYNKLIAFWEKGIHQIQMPKYEHSFHPKIWLIRYVSEKKGEPAFYKFLCTSRNLTFSRDWDLFIGCEGKVNKSFSDEQPELRAMLSYLDNHHPNVIPQIFFKEIEQVKFNSPSPFSEMSFHPIGISDEFKNPISENKVIADELMVVSPFLDKQTIDSLQQKCNQFYLLSTANELSLMDKEQSQGIENIYMFSPFIENAENMESFSETDEIPLNQNLHAKLFISKKGRETSWFIGSANATKPASNGNIEFLVQLKTTTKNLRPFSILSEFTNNEESQITLFEPYEGTPNPQPLNEKIKEQQIRKLIYQISGLKVKGEATKNAEGTFDLIIEIPEYNIFIPEWVDVRVRPLPEKNRPALSIKFGKKIVINNFNNYEEIELSSYLVYELWDGDGLVKQFVNDMLITFEVSRLNKIFTSIIGNQKRFLKYLFFLMSEETPDMPDAEDQLPKGKNATDENEIAFFTDSPVYEMLLRTASRDKGKLGTINKLIERVKNEYSAEGERIVPDEFIKMWNIFYEYAQTK